MVEKMSVMNSILEKIIVLNKLNKQIKRNIKLLFVFRDYLDKINVILVTNEDKVYCFGRNDYGVLGFDHNNSIYEFTINEELSNKRIVDFKSSFCHTIARDSDGKLYCWGRNRFLGNGRKDLEISKPELNKYLMNENIVDICCSSSHTLVLTSNNEVYAWGWNYWGQIGNRSSGNDVLIPFKVKEFNGDKLNAISCGSRHSMALSESGCVYSWGHNKCGQLGLNSENENEDNLKLIQIEVKIKKISCGKKHSLLLSREGDIYVFGSNKYNRLGLETNWGNKLKRVLRFNEVKQLTPIKLNHSEKFIDIASHSLYNISAALSAKGLYYVWGKCGKEGIISKPKATKFKSFNELFIHYCEITYKTETRKIQYISEFNELEMISFGNSGIVCKAIDKRNDKIFAIKKIPINDDLKEKALKEINILSKLESGRIVKLESFWIENNYYLKSDELLKKLSPSHELFKQNNTLLLHIQMELCYKTLREIIEIMNKELNQKYSEVMTPLGYYISSELFIEILESVDYLHKQNIIHRDLKPNNILITDGTKGHFVKIGDFGLATFHESEEQSHTKYRGTRKYMAPEVLTTRKYDKKADIYSLGISAPKLFNIDINEPIGGKSCLETEYKNLFALVEKMSSLRTNKRPDCEKILKEKGLWALSLTQLMKTNLKINVKIKPIEECFHMFFIQTKLNS